MTKQSDQRWKQYSPCRQAGDPNLFDVPTEATDEDWARTAAVAQKFCAGCPFLASSCAADLDGKWGVWAGSARWVRGSEVHYRRLIPTAPRPPFTSAKNVTPDPALQTRKRKAAA